MLLRLTVIGAGLVSLSGCAVPASPPSEPVAANEDVPAVSEIPGAIRTPDNALLSLIGQTYPEISGANFMIGWFDLNGDGTFEVLAHVEDRSYCGSGGCPLAVIAQKETGYTLVTSLSVARLPIGVFPTSTNGWRDLAVTVGGGGGPSGVARVPYDGASYAENPTVEPAELSDAPFDTVLTPQTGS